MKERFQEEEQSGYVLEKARLADVESIHKLINYFADRGEMLPRALSEIYENIRDFFVCRRDNDVVGCAALHFIWDDLAEIKAVAVSEDHHGEGIGSFLVNACLEEAQTMGLSKVFLLTYKPTFFERFGFEQVDLISTLPRKVWGECYDCPKYPGCGEIAMIRQV